MKYPWLYVGAKVVFVDGDGLRVRSCEAAPQIGSVYTVREIYLGTGVSIRLEEIVNPPYLSPSGYGEAAWNAARFRPVLPDTSKQVEAMRSLMLDATVRGRVDA